MRGPKNSKNSTPSSSAIPTGGKIFEDGSLIELVEDLKQPDGLGLLMWNGRKTMVSRRAVHEEQAYVPLALHPSVRRALRLASGSSPFTSTAKLFKQLVTLTGQFTGLPEHSCCQLVAFMFASWLADCLPAPVNLSLWSPVATDGARVLRLLSCLCRQALALAGTSARELALLPTELQATLLLFRPASGRRTRELLATCGWQGFHAARSGQFGEVVGSVALSTDAPLKDRTLEPMMEIPITPSRRPLPILDRRTQQKLAQTFQPQLLRYRLLHHETARTAEPAEAASAGSASQLVSGIRACFTDEPEISDQQVSLLLETQQHEDVACPTDPRMLLAEVLLPRCHEPGRAELHVAEIAVDMNAAIFSRGGTLKLSARLAGSLLKSVGLATHRLGRSGRGLTLDPPTRRAIHRLASVYNVPPAGQTFPGCTECAQAQESET